jgi:hypothetical protein
MPIKADLRGLQKLTRELVMEGERGRKELQRATSDMRRTAKPETNREIRKEYNVKVGPINERIKAETVSGEFAITIGAKNEKTKIPVSDFTGTRAISKGVRVKLLKSGAAVIVPRSFQGTSTINKRFVARESNKRFPLRSIGGATAREMMFERKGLLDSVVNVVLVRASKAVAKRLVRLRG